MEYAGDALSTDFFSTLSQEGVLQKTTSGLLDSGLELLSRKQSFDWEYAGDIALLIDSAGNSACLIRYVLRILCGGRLEVANNFKYLGSLITTDGGIR